MTDHGHATQRAKPQGLGGIFAGGATDPNAAPMFVLLAYVMYPVVSIGRIGVVVPHAAGVAHEMAVSVRPVSGGREPGSAASRSMWTMLVPSGVALMLVVVAIATGAAWLIVLVILAGPVGTATWIARLALTSDREGDAPAVLSRKLRFAGWVEATFNRLDASLLELFRRAPRRTRGKPVGWFESAVERIARHPLRLGSAPFRLDPKMGRARLVKRSVARESHDALDLAPSDPAQSSIAPQRTSTTSTAPWSSGELKTRG